MNLNFSNVYAHFNDIFREYVIDLHNIQSFSPWGVGLVCLKAVENLDNNNKSLVLPINQGALDYLKRIEFEKFVNELSYSQFLSPLDTINIIDINQNIPEIMHCSFRDEFSAKLESKIRMTFRNFGLKDSQEQKLTALVGELGNNVFDHNAGSWPTNIVGAIIAIQNYPKDKKIEIVVADPGVGFLKSLKLAKPDLNSELEAIKLGLTGVTGRVGEKRGNGLITIQDWTINQFSGIVHIHSGNGLVTIDKNGEKEKEVDRILGTLAGLELVYN